MRDTGWFRFDKGCYRHCEPTGRANARPITGSAKQSIEQKRSVDCFAALAMTVRILALLLFENLNLRTHHTTSVVPALAHVSLDINSSADSLSMISPN